MREHALVKKAVERPLGPAPLTAVRAPAVMATLLRCAESSAMQAGGAAKPKPAAPTVLPKAVVRVRFRVPPLLDRR